MTHPIIPPPDLRRQWLDNDHFCMVTGTHDLMSITRDRLNSVIDQAARWGADQELEACCECLDSWGDIHNSYGYELASDLRTARRPKPPSLKEQALEDWDRLVVGKLCTDETCIRRALEALPNDY